MIPVTPPRRAALAHGEDRARRGCRCALCVPTGDTDPAIRRPTRSAVTAAVTRHLDALDVTDDRRTLALQLAEILDSDRPHNRLRHRIATVELLELIGALARDRILRTADTGRADT